MRHAGMHAEGFCLCRAHSVLQHGTCCMLWTAGHVIDWSVDIYALGICMAWLVTNHHPYPHLSDEQIVEAVQKDGARPVFPETVPSAYR